MIDLAMFGSFLYSVTMMACAIIITIFVVGYVRNKT